MGKHHDGKGTRLYATWKEIRRERWGTPVCGTWRYSFPTFRDWAMSTGYQDNLYLQMRDIHGVICPENCSWGETPQNRRATHRGTGTRLFNIWKGIHKRCRSTEDRNGRNYGGRGICVCKTWNQFEPFRSWAMANGYRDDLTIERIDVEGHYGPDNCTWIPHGDQTKNHRDSVRLTAFGETKIAADWLKDPRCKVGTQTFYSRLHRGWDAELAITTPARPMKPFARQRAATEGTIAPR